MSYKDCKCIGCDYYEGDHPEFGYVFCSVNGGRSMANGSGCSQFSPDITASCLGTMGRCRHCDENHHNACSLGLRSHIDSTVSYCRSFSMRNYFNSDSGKKSGCFVSSAACNSFGLPHDCAELKFLRHIRDEYLMKIEFGQKMIFDYYKFSPVLVDTIEASLLKDEIYKAIMININLMMHANTVKDFIDLYVSMIFRICELVEFDLGNIVQLDNYNLLVKSTWYKETKIDF